MRGKIKTPFSSLAAVRDFSENIRADYKQIDVLSNSAGMGPGSRRAQRELSKYDHELRFAVPSNYSSQVTDRVIHG